jgi:hypothetical protein
MLDIDFSSPLDQVRMNVGDADSTVVSDNMINSALVAFNNNVYMASVAVMGVILTEYSRLADREREGNVEVYYTKLYERYKDRFEEFKRAGGSTNPSNKAFMPIIIGGVSRTQKDAIRNVADNFSMYDLAHWHSESLGHRSLYELYSDEVRVLNNG